MDIVLRLILLSSAAGLIAVVAAQGGSEGNACQSGTCLNGGSCTSNHPILYNCTCRSGFFGQQCQIPSPCNSATCLNGGTCMSDDPGGILFNCTCTPGYTGNSCQNRDFCYSNPCRNNGNCTNLSDTYDCSCVIPWEGSRCTRYNPCRLVECQRESDCLNRPDGTGQIVAKCRCRPGTYGEFCQFDTNECETGEGGCVNGGTCVDVTFGFECRCPENITGRYCERDVNGTVTVDPCLSNPCKNGATCDPGQPWRVVCGCQPGWGGTFCERGSCTHATENDYNDGYDYDYEEPGDGIKNAPAEFAYNLSEDYCFFDSVCQIPDPNALPTCDCQQGYRGNRCFLRYTVLQEVSPIVGPRSGGTDILFRGINMNGTTDRPIVSIGDSTCTWTFGNDTLLVYTTRGINSSYVNLPQNLTILFRNTGLVIDVPEDFTYKPDPTITKVEPTESIISGGVTLTVDGTGLDAVGKPILQITVVYRRQPVHVFDSLCTVVSPTRMLCPTPTLHILDGDGNLDFSSIPPPTPEYPRGPGGPINPASFRKKREAPASEEGLLGMPRKLYSYLLSLHRHRRQADNTKVAELRVDNETVEFYIGFRLDGVQTYKNLTETLPQYSKLTVFVDPKISPWVEQKTITISSNMLEVEGERLTTGIRSTDYKVLIGSTDCTKVEVFTNRIICTAPQSTPEPHPEDTSTGTINVRVRIGSFKDPFFVGEVTYKTSFWDNPVAKWSIIGAIVGLVIIAIIVIAIIAARCTK